MSFHTPIEFVEKIQESQVFIKRDDLLGEHSFGTKTRKFQGFYKYLLSQHFSLVLLFGNLHSNYLAAFSYLLAKYDVPFFVLAYSKNLSLQSFNSKIVKKFSQLKEFSSSDKMYFYMKTLLDKRKNILQLPQFGFHFSSLNGLDSLSEEILKSHHSFDKIFVDVGSGLTFLSLYKVFREKVFGVCIGANLSTLQKELTQKSKELNIQLESPNLLSSAICSKFGKVNQTLLDYTKKYYQKNKIALEPIYSAKSVYTIEKVLAKEKIKQKILYVHQGGLGNFFDLC